MLVSVGYQGRDLDEFVELLGAQGVRELIDVRFRASSRKPGFSKTKLSEALEQAGSAYTHLPALGNPPDNRDPFRDGVPAAVARYRTILDGDAADALDDLVERASTAGPVAMLCVCRDHDLCHRRVIAEVAQELDPTLALLRVE